MRWETLENMINSIVIDHIETEQLGTRESETQLVPKYNITYKIPFTLQYIYCEYCNRYL